MTLVLITPAATFPVEVVDAKEHVRVLHNDDDAHIEMLIAAATARAEKETGRPYTAQTWEWVADEFPCGEIEIPLGPVTAVASVKYLDDDGVEQTVSASDYQVDTVSPDGRVVPVGDWPTAGDKVNAVRVRFSVGATTPPADVREAILMMVAHWYRYRGDASPAPLHAIPLGASDLLSLHRRMFV